MSKIFPAIVFLIIGFFLILYNELISELLNKHSSQSSKDIKHLIGKESMVTVNKKHIKFMGVVFIFVSLFFFLL